MKNLLTVLLSIWIGISHAQVLKFKAFQTYHRNNGDFKDVSDKDWINTDFLIVTNFDKNKINTYGQTKGDFDILKYDSNDTDENGNIVWKLDLLDKSAEKCKAEVIFYKQSPTFHIGTLILYYPYEQIFFRLKRDE